MLERYGANKSLGRGIMGWHKPIVAMLTSFLWTMPAPAGQSFSCSFGEPACLDYGAVVCKSGAQCVARDSVCFDSYTCDYEGFACKSKLDDAVEAYDTQRGNYNELVDKFNSLNSSYEEARTDLEAAQSKARRVADCVSSATTVDDAKGCF